MLDSLGAGVLPVFALVAIGFALGRLGLFDRAMAAAVNRLVFLVSVPALIFGLLARSPFERFDWPAVIAFLAVELAMYAAGFLVTRHLFRRGAREALLIGLASAFANHLLFVLPIALSLFGQDAALPIVAVATLDALLIYGGTLLLMDALSGAGGGVVKALSRNPQVLATLAGLAVGLSGVELARGVYVFADFAGGTASPCSLFALGVILSRQEGEAPLALPATIAGLKLVAYPVLCWGLLVAWLGTDPGWARPAMMVAAAPSSAMAFVLALNYGVPTQAIARIVLVTMLGSLLTVSLAAGL